MTADQLKNSILQMAVQGKLIPQDPDDEPASVLLERIRAEKDQMIKEGKIKKEKNPSYIFRGSDGSFYEKIGNKEPVCIEDEVPFEIPDNWEWTRLGSILSVISDGTHKTPNYVEKGVPFLSVQNISSGKLDLSKVKYIEKTEHQKLIERVCPQLDDILFCRIGTLGKAIKVTWDFPFSIFVSLGLLRAIFPETADYIVFIINSPLGYRWIQENKVGGGTHTFKINLVNIPHMLIPFPPLQEQRRILKQIDKYTALCSQYKNAENKLTVLQKSFPEELKKSVLQLAVQGKLVPQDSNDEPASVLLDRIHVEKEQLIREGKIKRDKHESVIYRRDGAYYEKIDGKEFCIDDEIPFDIPNNWIWVRLSSIAKTISAGGDKPSKYSKESTCECQIPIYSNGERKDGLYGYTDEPRVTDPSITISGRGTIGYSCVRRTPYVPIVRLISVTPMDKVDLDFLNYAFMALLEQGVGTSIKQLTVPMIEFKLIPLPPLSEQNRIVDKINSILPYIDNL